MKKIGFSLVGLLFLLFLNNCSTTEQYIEPQQIEPDPTAEIIIFKQDFMHNLEVEDSVDFFNSEKIVLERNFHFKNYHVKEGVRHKVDSFFFVQKTILPYTCGRVVKITKDDWGEIMSVLVSFSEEKGDESYNLSFFCIDKEGWFILSGGGATYSFRGQSYPLTVRTKGSCILMVKPPEYSTIFTESYSIFKGWKKK